MVDFKQGPRHYCLNTYPHEMPQATRRVLFAVVLALRILIPVVPSIAASSSSIFARGIDVHSHPTRVHAFTEHVPIFYIAHKDVVPLEAQEPANIPPLAGTDAKIILDCFPFPIGLVSTQWQIFSIQKFPADFGNESRHSARVYHNEGEPSLTASKFQRAIAVEDVSALKIFQVSVSASDSEPAKHRKAISEIGNQEISKSGFVAQPMWQQSVKIRGAAFFLIVSGLLLLNYETAVYFIGATLTMCGISLALYGPDIWLLWSAQ